MQVKWTLLVAMVMGLWVGAAAQATALQERAWKGDSIAMLDLSEAYTFGKGVTKNEDSAKVYRKKAAEKGLVEAQFLYGTDLVVDVFSTTNYAKGVAMLKKAADQGHKDAQYRLSEIHRSKGRGNESDKFYDLKKAYSYSELAAAQNVPEALMYCAESKLTGTGTTKSDSVACVYFQKAANEKKYVPAFIRMGDMYFEGRATGKVEPFLAVEWYRKALALKHANIDQRGKAEEGIHNVDNFFKQIQNYYLDASPMMPMGMFDYRIR
ncbi:MAG: tetratricopeptide repeat protein [Bacteroidia bacterium]